MEHPSPFVCELTPLTPTPSLFIASRTAHSAIGELFNEGFPSILALLSRQGLAPLGPPYAIYGDIGPDELDVEFGFPVPPEAEGEGRIERGETPSGPSVSCLHTGPYVKVEPAYSALLTWIAENGRAATGRAMEIYIDNPSETPPEQLRTRVHLLLEGA
ncbi:GyrI-like domain-containing protein [Chlorobium sp. N1]|uniref:GyrI-like domain-containing protein n=1 Tax=Chlorobium sp. N1 TaxID=2491138 RepID=UPI001040D443|nr:GyrI-like domain-containing protein [Chlorobium sp. N1]TCD48012.1 AraC family transcriptional regulator [Chlorobium sp. N1]